MKKIEINNENWYWWILAFIEIWWVKYTILNFNFLHQLVTVKEVKGRECIGDVVWFLIGMSNIVGLIILISGLLAYIDINGIPEFKLTLWKSRKVEDEDNLSK